MTDFVVVSSTNATTVIQSTPSLVAVQTPVSTTVTIPTPGPAGPAGATGATGPAGPANTLTIGTVTTLTPGSSATATVSGTAPNQTLDLGIPQGATGATGGATTAVTGMVKGNGSVLVAAVSGTDFQPPIGTISGIVKGNGANALTAATASDITTAIGATAVTNATNSTNATTSTTQAVDTNTTAIATTAFVIGQAASATPAALGTAAVGTSTRFARGDHVHASPTYTTQAYGDATTNVATTAFVDALRDVVGNSQSTSYTLALTDRGKSIDFTGATGQTITVPANASVAFPVNSVVTITNTTANNLSIAITTDTLRQAGTANVGTRTLGQYGVATLRKVASTVWIISGSGLT